MRSAKDSPAAPFERTREAGEVLAGMKLALPRKSQALAGLESVEGSASGGGNVGEAGTPRRSELEVEEVRRCVASRDEVPVEPLEVAVDVLLAHDGLDAIDGGRVALGGAARTVRSM